MRLEELLDVIPNDVDVTLKGDIALFVHVYEKRNLERYVIGSHPSYKDYLVTCVDYLPHADSMLIEVLEDVTL